jgi:hypothetical protein
MSVVIITVRKVSDKFQTAQIIKRDLSIWERDGWEQYGVEESRESVEVTIATTPDTSSSSLTPKIDTTTLAPELTEKEFTDSLPSEIINVKLASMFYRAGIRSKAQLLATTDEKLLLIPGIGRAKIRDIRNAVKV